MDYLLTDEGFNNQCNNELELYKDKSEQSDVEIAKINELRAKRKEFIQQLKILRQIREKMV